LTLGKNGKTKMSSKKIAKEEIIELMIQASKWGSWAYDLKERDEWNHLKNIANDINNIKL